MRLNLFLPYLRHPKKDPKREMARPFKRMALKVLPDKVFSHTDITIHPSRFRKILKALGPTWLSAPVRRCVQAICFITFLWLFFYVCWPYGDPDHAGQFAAKEFIAAETFLAIDPLVSISTALAAKAWVWSLFWAAGILLVCVVFPRGFCGYLCPLGTLIDLFDFSIGKHVTRFRVKHDGWWVNLKYYLLLGVLICSLFGILISGFFAAIPVITRGLLFTAAPIQMGSMRGFYQVPPITAGQIFSIALFFGVLGLGFLRPRFWCRHVCPSGAVFSVANVFRAGERKVEDTCIKCNKCIEICPFDAIKADFTTRTSDCTLCQTCGGVCPTHAIKFVDRWDTHLLKAENDPPTNETKLTRRGLLTGVAAGAVIATAIRIPLPIARGSDVPVIRPPGSVPEPDFLQLCIRCGECFKACPNNVLQPMSFSGGINNLWTPEAVPSWSGCEPSCNNCGQVCPTGAIRALPLPEKAAARMGLAIVNEVTCLPYAGKEACDLCIVECKAAGYDAIGVQRVGTQVDDEGMPIEGSGFEAPVINADLCVGCGLCETRCINVNVKAKGLLEKTAIFVEAGEGKEDRITTGSYIQLAADRKKAKLQAAPDTAYSTDS